jgi:hypothetical protein
MFTLPFHHNRQEVFPGGSRVAWLTGGLSQVKLKRYSKLEW